MTAQLLGFVASMIVLLGYFVSVHLRRPGIFDWCNVAGAIILVPVNVSFGTFFGVFLSGAFGLIALYSIFGRVFTKKGESDEVIV